MTTDDSSKEWNGPAYTVVRGHKVTSFDPEVVESGLSYSARPDDSSLHTQRMERLGLNTLLLLFLIGEKYPS